MLKSLLGLIIALGTSSASAVTYRCSADYVGAAISCCGRNRVVTFDLAVGGLMSIQDQGKTSHGRSELDWSKNIRVTSVTPITTPYKGLNVVAKFTTVADGTDVEVQHFVKLAQQGTSALMDNFLQMQCKRIR